MKGRPPLPQGQARTAVLKARVKPHAAAHFRAVAKTKGLTESQALRQAMALWTKQNDRSN